MTILALKIEAIEAVSALFTLTADHVDEPLVLIADLRQHVASFDVAAGLLSPEEQKRAARFRFDRDRHRFVQRHALLRQLLGGFLDTPPSKVAFSTNAHGKPALLGDHGLRFNMSYSDEFVCFAFTREREIGVDIETVRPYQDLSAAGHVVFSPVDNSWLASLPPYDRCSAFFRLWVRAEAYVKAKGTGLQEQLTESFQSLDSPHQCYVNEPAASWKIVDIACGSDCVGAVGVQI